MNNRGLGLVLTALGVLLLLINLKVLPGLNILLIIGICFLLVYFLKANHLGFLIPGSILTFIGLFILFKETGFIPDNADSSFLLFLAGAFWVVLFVHTIRIKTNEWGARFWPVFPAGALTIIGSIGLSKAYFNINLTFMKFIWPVLLILAGILLLIKSKQ